MRGPVLTALYVLIRQIFVPRPFVTTKPPPRSVSRARETHPSPKNPRLTRSRTRDTGIYHFLRSASFPGLAGWHIFARALYKLCERQRRVMIIATHRGSCQLFARIFALDFACSPCFVFRIRWRLDRGWRGKVFFFNCNLFDLSLEIVKECKCNIKSMECHGS